MYKPLSPLSITGFGLHDIIDNIIIIHTNNLWTIKMTKRTAIITGASQGIGKAIALNFASKNIHVVLASRTESKLREVADEIIALKGSSTVAVVDITDGDSVLALAKTLADQTIDILVNCAGDWLIESIDTTTDDNLDHILNINLKAPYRLSRAFLPHLRKSDNASIINIGSIAAVHSFGEITAYTAAKAGLRGLTGSLAEELKSELIRVVMLSPSPANTPMRWAASPDIDPDTLIQPESIAKMVSVIVELPQGITTGDLVLKSMLMDMDG